MCSTYGDLKKDNFGMNVADMEDLFNILPVRKSPDIIQTKKIIEWLNNLNKVKENNDINEKNLYKEVSKLTKYQPSKMQICRVYYERIIWPNWTDNKKIESELPKNLLENISLNNVRGSYGVVNLTALTEPFGSCENDCSFCPNPPKFGPYKAARSYDIFEPAVMRGAKLNFNLIAQLRTRVKDLAIGGSIVRNYNNGKWSTHCKADIRLAGGTFGHYPIEKQKEFIRDVYYFARTIDFNDDDMPQKMSLDEEIEWHVVDSSSFKIVALSIETRPDKITEHILDMYNTWYLTFVEMGVQTTNDNVLKIVKRGHKVKHSEEALGLCKQYGFKVLGHFMQDLPGSTPEIDRHTFNDHVSQKHITNSVPLPHRYDHIKIYPTLKLPHTEIEKWDSSKWDRYSEKEGGTILIKVLCDIVKDLPPWVRIARLFRDFQQATEKNKGHGYDSTTLCNNLSQIVMDKLLEDGDESQDIRTQEVRSKEVNIKNKKINTYKYHCANGMEYFCSINAPDINNNSKLLGLMRVRFNNKPSPCKYVKDSAIVREVHVYGNYTPVGQIEKKTYQHRGYGKYLLVLAETMAYIRGFKSIVVLSAAGTVNYYSKSGYYRHGRYSKKDLTFMLFILNVIKIIKFYFE